MVDELPRVALDGVQHAAGRRRVADADVEALELRDGRSCTAAGSTAPRRRTGALRRRPGNPTIRAERGGSLSVTRWSAK